MTTIAPCPFCSHDDVEIDEFGIGEFAVDCPECRCIGPIFPSVMDAIRAWNGSIDRAQQADLRDVLRRARAVIDEDREAVWCCHVNTSTGKIDDQFGKNAIANYDEILSQIDNALEAAS